MSAETYTLKESSLLTINNRLDSRQRKKQHTERLEEEKKNYTSIMTELEERVAELEMRDTQHRRAEEQWKATQQQYEHYVETLHLDKEELVRRHTLETGELRKKNAFLTEHMQKLESTAMSAVPSSSGYSNNEFSDLESITMEGAAPWEQYSFLDDFSLETEPKPVMAPQPPPPPSAPTSLILPSRKLEKTADADKPAASGILLVVSAVCSRYPHHPSNQVLMNVRPASALRCLCRLEKRHDVESERAPHARRRDRRFHHRA